MPWPVAAAAVIAVALLTLPLLALLLRAPWSQLGELLTRESTLSALGLSLGTAAVSTLLCLILGVPLALVLARSDDAPPLVRRGLRALVTIPLVLPPVVGGLALLLLLGRSGVLGAPLEALTGVTIPFTTLAVVLAQTFVAMPFLVLAVEGALRGVDPATETAAETLGASRATVLRRVTLPLAAPGILAGTILCAARALGEFGATITFAGSFPGTTQTLPIATYLELQRDPEAAVALALVLVAVALVTLVAMRDRWVPGATA
ncbi:MAG: ABC transporter permease [Microcella sp.]|uniref:ABC transporter permease n=1 Tax=Microcella sp. TaxID=1913979 RepID=UPI00331547AE